MSSVTTSERVSVYGPPYVTPSDPYYGFGGEAFELSLSSPIFDGGMPPNILAQRYFANGLSVLQHTCEECLDEFCKAMSKRPPEFIQSQMIRYAAYNAWVSVNYTQFFNASANASGSGDFANSLLLPLQAWIEDGMRFPPEARERFYVTPILPLTGLNHWLEGTGTPAYIPIEALSLSVHFDDFAPLRDVLANPDLGAGSYAVSGAFDYNTFSESLAGGLLGRVVGDISGTLTVASDGTFTFDGSFGIATDTYDANRSNRPDLQEKLTTFLGVLSNTFGSKDYQIYIDGRQSVHFEGVKNP